MRYLIPVFLTTLAITCSGGGGGGAAQGAFSAVDLQGKEAHPLQNSQCAATVLVFLAVDCPISNKYAPELRRLSARFGAQHIPFWFVYPDKDSTLEVVAKHVRELGLDSHVLRDPHQVLVRKAHARITPEAAVFNPKGTLVYHGPIDNRFVALGRERAAATQFPLQEVLEAILHGQPIPVPQSQAVGCPIPD